MYNEPDHNTIDSNEYNIVTSPFSKIICLTMTIDVQVTFLLITVIVRTRAMLVAKQRVGLPFDLSSIYSIR